MPDASLVDATAKILDAGVLGAALIFCIAALVWVVRQWLAAQRQIDTLQEARLSDVREHVALGTEAKQTMQAITVAMQANTLTLQGLVETMRSRK